MLLAPGYFSLPEDQQKMVKKLNACSVSMIIEMPEETYDGLEDRKVDKFAFIVSKYIRENYTHAQKIGRFVIKTRD